MHLPHWCLPFLIAAGAVLLYTIAVWWICHPAVRTVVQSTSRPHSRRHG